jgi:hypothetical protein
MDDFGSIESMMKPRDVGGINEIIYKDWKFNQSIEKTL